MLKAIIINLFYRSNSKKIKYLRSKGVGIGKNCSLYNKISDFSTEPYLISIGDNVTITSGVKLLTHDGGMRVLIKSGFLEKADKFGKITIGNNVFIGLNTIVLPNVTIGDNCVIGAGSIVTKSLDSNSVYAGNPARFICTLEDYYNKNKDLILQTRGLSVNEKKDIILKEFK